MSNKTRIPLNKLQVGQTGVLVETASPDGNQAAARRRMLDMGLVRGAHIKLVRKAPLGDPLEYQVRGYSLSLRKSEAEAITVEVES